MVPAEVGCCLKKEGPLCYSCTVLEMLQEEPLMEVYLRRENVRTRNATMTWEEILQDLQRDCRAGEQKTNS
jgi:hypothetical protein